MPLTITISTDASWTSIPIDIVTPPNNTPASSVPTVRSAMTMFWRMTLTVRFARPMACGIRSSRLVISAMSAVSTATAEPAAPIAIPTSARASAGASLTPSPTIATTRPSA